MIINGIVILIVLAFPIMYVREFFLDDRPELGVHVAVAILTGYTSIYVTQKFYQLEAMAFLIVTTIAIIVLQLITSLIFAIIKAYRKR